MGQTAAEELFAVLCAPADAPAPAVAGWDTLVAEAVKQAAAPHLLDRLRALAATGAVPAAALQIAWVAAARQKQQTAGFQTDLGRALEALAARGIVPVLLKGAHLASSIYPSPAHRPMGDLDLLVRFDELEAAEAALLAIGYATDRTDTITDFCRRSHQIPTLKADGHLPIELHWTIAIPADGVTVDTDGLRGRVQLATIDGRTAGVLAPEDLLLHICLHGGRSHLFGEKGFWPLLDIRAILWRHGEGFDWDAFAARAVAWNVAAATFVLLELAAAHAHVAVPAAVRAQLRPAGATPDVLEAAWRQLLEPPGQRYELSPEHVARHWVSVAGGANQTSSGGRSATTLAGQRLKRLVGFVTDFMRNGARNPRNAAAALGRMRRGAKLERWLQAQDGKRNTGA